MNSAELYWADVARVEAARRRDHRMAMLGDLVGATFLFVFFGIVIILSLVA